MFGTTALISSSKELNDIMKIVISLEEFVFVFKKVPAKQLKVE